MFYHSTRDKKQLFSLTESLTKGLAPDGGLFVPEHFPKMDLRDFAHLNYHEFAQKILGNFVDEPVSSQLLDLCQSAFNFDVPVKKVSPQLFMLELFHGPTVSFKDFGARFLAASMAAISKTEKITIMTATSGDTGSAVASAFYGKPNIRVIVLYPKGQISRRQEHQLSSWDKNILALSVKSNFDECQALVKSAFQHHELDSKHFLSSANSINIGRLLPQTVYYAYSSLKFYEEYREQPGYIIPTGNLGNATAAYWAKEMGFPIREIVLACNANAVIKHYLESGKFNAQKSIPTLANAMDVGNPSNFERLLDLFQNNYDLFKKNVSVFCASDNDIKKMILEVYQKHQLMICPHTATAFYAHQFVNTDKPWITVATADPAKFEEIIEPIIGCSVPLPHQLQETLSRDLHIRETNPQLDEIKKIAKNYFNTEEEVI